MLLPDDTDDCTQCIPRNIQNGHTKQEERELLQVS